MKLLTPQEVGEMIHLSRRKVLELPIAKIRVGKGRGKILYTEEDVKSYLRECTEYPALKGESHANGVSKRPQKMGLQVLPSREMLEKIRLGYGSAGAKRGGGTAH